MDARDEELVEEVLARASGAASQLHGEQHWRAVAYAGLLLAKLESVDRRLVFLFALLHDACRLNDGHDPEHGERAVALALELEREGLIELDGRRLSLLAQALRHHDQGLLSDEPTVAVCWDADRLNLWRVGVEPDPELLSTAAAQDPDLIAQAADFHYQPLSWAELAAALCRPALAEPELLASATLRPSQAPSLSFER